MQVILLRDVKNVGKKDEIKEVSDGYASNFLFPQKLAIQYTKGSAQVLDKQVSARKEAHNQAKEQAQLDAKRLEDVTIGFKLKVGAENKVFGSVTSKQIKEALQEQFGIDIDRKKILLKDNITALGITNVKVELFIGVTGSIKVKVEAK